MPELVVVLLDGCTGSGTLSVELLSLASGALFDCTDLVLDRFELFHKDFQSRRHLPCFTSLEKSDKEALMLGVWLNQGHDGIRDGVHDAPGLNLPSHDFVAVILMQQVFCLVAQLAEALQAFEDIFKAHDEFGGGVGVGEFELPHMLDESM